jgi:hypothetical protein
MTNSALCQLTSHPPVVAACSQSRMFISDTHVPCHSTALSIPEVMSSIPEYQVNMMPTDPTTQPSAVGIYHIPRCTHTPLDQNQPSIRILRVLPTLSSEGLLQCDLANTHINDDFTCLSYNLLYLGRGKHILLRDYEQPTIHDPTQSTEVPKHRATQVSLKTHVDRRCMYRPEQRQ